MSAAPPPTHFTRRFLRGLLAAVAVSPLHPLPRLHASPGELRFARASAWTFFNKVCSGLQQISHISIVVRQQLLVAAGTVDVYLSPAQVTVSLAEAAIANKSRFLFHAEIKAVNMRPRKKNPPG
jgi:hypothetical protein